MLKETKPEEEYTAEEERLTAVEGNDALVEDDPEPQANPMLWMLRSQSPFPELLPVELPDELPEELLEELPELPLP